MSDATERLRQVADQATDGPWHWLPDSTLATVGRGTQYIVRAFRKGMNSATVRFRRDGLMEEGTDNPDALYIATFDSSLVAAMLDVIDAAEQINEMHVRDALARFREVASGSKPFSSDTEVDDE